MKKFKHYLLTEGGNSGAVRYNTELASILSFVNLQKDLNGFNPKDPNFNPRDWFDPKRFQNPEEFYKEVLKFLPKYYNKKKFDNFYSSSAKFKKDIIKKNGKNPQFFSWAGGSNETGDEADPADVGFINQPTFGISIKDSGGITLSNLSPARLGVELARGVDAVQYYASLDGSKSFNNWKKAVIKKVCELAKKQGEVIPDKRSPHYKIEYIKGKFITTFKKKRQEFTYSEMTTDTNLEKNQEWQTVFGVYLTNNPNEFKKETSEVYANVAKHLIPIIKKTMVNSKDVLRLLNINYKPYFYQNDKKLYYVPSIQEFADNQLEIKDIDVSSYDTASGILLKVNIGRKNSKEYATIDLWLRYANRVFGKNSTVRIQSLKNPENIAWEKLN